MPIALLLEETTAAFRYGERLLTPWARLVEIEELLIDRARSAFLVHWFGAALPLHGFEVRVVIGNLEELRRRYEEVKRAVSPAAEGPNLTEPLLGTAGVLAGVLLTPGVALGTGIALARKSLPWYLGILAIGLAAVAGVVVVALSPALAAGAFLGQIETAAVPSSPVRALFDLLGAAARLLVAARRFLGLLLGPRSAVKSPVLLLVLGLADQLARLVPFALALVAVAVTRFGPLLAPLAAQWAPFLALLGEAFAFLKVMLQDLVAGLTDAFTSDDGFFAILGQAFRRLGGPLPALLAAFGAFFDRGAVLLEAWWDDVARRMKVFGAGLGAGLKAVLAKHPVAERWSRLTDALKLAVRLYREATPAPAKGGGGPTPFDPWAAQAKLWADAAERTSTAFPMPPALEGPGALIDRLGLKAKHGIPANVGARAKALSAALPPVDAAVRRYVERARHPTSAFAYEREALAQEQGAKTPAAALAVAREHELELRQLVEAVVGRVLPPDLRPLMIPLAGALEEVDEGLSLDAARKGSRKPGAGKPRKKAGPAPLPFPVLDLPEPDSGLLRPVVQRLVVRARGATREELQAFAALLRPRLDRAYPATAPASA